MPTSTKNFRLRLAWLFALAATALTVSATAQPSPDYADMVFATTPQRELKLDLYLPKQTHGAPIIVYVHGGGWRRGNPKQVPFADLTEEGFAVASITYRFSHEARFPAQLDDVKAALTWLKSNAALYGADSSRIALVGGSAGAHLAMLAGLRSDASTTAIRAIVSYFGPSDFLLRARTQPKSLEAGSTVHDLLGGPATGLESLAREASPAFHVTSAAPPLLIFHGSKDTTVLLDQSERMVDAYRIAGRPVELRVKEGATHRISDFEDSENRAALIAFLQKYLTPRERPE